MFDIITKGGAMPYQCVKCGKEGFVETDEGILCKQCHVGAERFEKEHPLKSGSRKIFVVDRLKNLWIR